MIVCREYGQDKHSDSSAPLLPCRNISRAYHALQGANAIQSCAIDFKAAGPARGTGGPARSCWSPTLSPRDFDKRRALDPFISQIAPVERDQGAALDFTVIQ